MNGHKKKDLSQNNAILRSLAPDFIGSEAIFQVDALKVVEVNVLSDQFFDLKAGRIMSSIQTFGFERTKEIFHGFVIVRAARTGHKRSKVVFFAQVEVCRGSVLRPMVTVEGESISDLLGSLRPLPKSSNSKQSHRKAAKRQKDDKTSNRIREHNTKSSSGGE